MTLFVLSGACDLLVLAAGGQVYHIQSLQLRQLREGLYLLLDDFIVTSSFGYSHQGSPQQIFHLQLFLSSAPSSVTSTSAMSSFTTSINILFGLPRFLFPGNSILSILLPIYPSSFLSTCPYHLSLASRVFSPNRPTCAVPLMYSLLILSILVTPKHLQLCHLHLRLLPFSQCHHIQPVQHCNFNIWLLPEVTYIDHLTVWL